MGDSGGTGGVEGGILETWIEDEYGEDGRIVGHAAEKGDSQKGQVNLEW